MSQTPFQNTAAGLTKVKERAKSFIQDVRLQNVLTLLIFTMAVAIFGLSVKVLAETKVTEADLLLGTVVSDADRNRIKAVAGLGVAIAALTALKEFLRYREAKT